jgi:hypothetical protein
LMFDNLPADERESLINLREEREPGKARPVVADEARAAYDETVRNENRYERERRRESLRLGVQARADAIFNELGQRCPPPMASEPLTTYRHRLAKALARYSPSYKNINIGELRGGTLDVCEQQIYADAAREAKAPTDLMPGMLRMIEKKRDGHTIREFHGLSPAVWMNAFAGPVQLRATGTWKTRASSGFD